MTDNADRGGGILPRTARYLLGIVVIATLFAVWIYGHEHELQPTVVENEMVEHWHWPGCTIPPCPPPLDGGPQTFTAAELAHLLQENPGLCTCALLCPAKCEPPPQQDAPCPYPELDEGIGSADCSCVKQCLVGGAATCEECCRHGHGKCSGCFPHDPESQ